MCFVSLLCKVRIRGDRILLERNWNGNKWSLNEQRKSDLLAVSFEQALALRLARRKERLARTTRAPAPYFSGGRLQQVFIVSYLIHDIYMWRVSKYLDRPVPSPFHASFRNTLDLAPLDRI